jgi:hypothetical protein
VEERNVGEMKRREFIRAGAAAVTTSLLAGAKEALRVEIWHGLHHRVGFLGDAQDDFNLLGHVYSSRPIASVTCSVNGSKPRPLQFKVFRRIVRYEDFNADIPVAALHTGDNRAVIEATDSEGRTTSAHVTITRSLTGKYPLPVRISWGSVDDLENVGQVIDGHWNWGPHGIWTDEIGYDRIFLIGNRTWRDYEATAPLTIHGFSAKNGPWSGKGHATGFCLRWAGHSTEDNAPGVQPKWGLHPRGGVTWLVWRTQDASLPPVRNFLRGDSEEHQDFAPLPVRLGRPFWMKGRCETLAGDGVTRYSFKVWNTSEPEPAAWDFQYTQKSQTALRTGGLALVAHETDVTFGNIAVTKLSGK